ncbi:hypothetical protein B0A52_09818 [Exophiala mesophila]|uniref:Copper acquisition factor BIM1-like domain-containing protein n=1 Tax=Exophiala mesophila TaxID=212818 RepID=A0A438MTJ8_EXOME|nr:hypothetical protein B0A52_09818 [Exophiala mesophila]
MIAQSLLALLALPLLSSAHFELSFPPARDDDDTNQGTWPCGGHDAVSERTSVALTGFPVSVELGHTENLFQIVLSIGDEGDNFHHVILPTIQEFGPGDFCLPNVVIPSDLNITDGTNGTIQVITNAHSGGGLYNCADITFTSTEPETPSSCTNGTGISAVPLAADVYTNANETTDDHDGHGDSSASASSTDSTPSSTASSTESAAPAETGNYANMLTAGWGVIGAAVLGAVALL